MKKGLVQRNLLFLSLTVLLVFAIFASMSLISAVDPVVPAVPASGDPAVQFTDTQIQGFDCTKSLDQQGFLEKRFCIWKEGSKSLDDAAKRDLVGETIKYLLLIIITFLVYSSLSYVRFTNIFFTFLLSLVIGFLATFLITTNEMITMMQSYTAMGVALSVFLPIAILAFFTMVVSSKGSPIGIFVQKILWVIYSVYLFLKTATLFLWTRYFAIGPDGHIQQIPGMLPPSYLKPFFPGTAKLQTLLITNDNVMLATLLITAIAVFFIMVVGNKIVEAWLAKEKMDSEVQSQKQMIHRSHDYDKTRSDAMQKN